MKRLLFINDNLDFAESNRLYFTRKGYEVFCVVNPAQAFELLATTKLDCVILDLDMAEKNGFDICRKLRESSSIPVIFLSSCSDAETRINSFLAGGDDFLSKPYSPFELELRIEARTRRNEAVFFSGTLQYGALTIDMDRRLITYGEKTGDFSALQFDILAFMARNPGKVFSYEQLYDQIWKTPIVKSRHNLQVAIATIRKKLENLCGGRQYIQNVSRKGYFFLPPPGINRTGSVFTVTLPLVLSSAASPLSFI